MCHVGTDDHPQTPNLPKFSAYYFLKALTNHIFHTSRPFLTLIVHIFNMDGRQSTCKPMVLYLLCFLLLSLGHHAYRFRELQCIQVRGIGFWTHTLYEVLGNLGLYGYNRYPFSNHAPAISEKHYFQPTSIFRQPGVEAESMAPPTSKSRPYGGMNVYLLAFIAAFMAPIIAALSIKIKLVLCAFVTSVLTTSMALVSAIIGWDLISEFLSEIGMLLCPQHLRPR